MQTRLAGGRHGRLPEPAVRKTLRAGHAFWIRPAPRRRARDRAGHRRGARCRQTRTLLLDPLRRRYCLDLRILTVKRRRGWGRARTARFLRHDPPTAAEVRALRWELRALVSGILPAGEDGEMLVGLGGTIRTLARIQRAAERREKAIQGTRLARASVAAMRERLETLSLRRRRGVKGLKPERADIIVAGAVIVEELMAIGGYERLTVCAHGVRHAVLLEETFGRVTSA